MVSGRLWSDELGPLVTPKVGGFEVSKEAALSVMAVLVTAIHALGEAGCRPPPL